MEKCGTEWKNSILGRSSTNEELEFLTQADSSF